MIKKEIYFSIMNSIRMPKIADIVVPRVLAQAQLRLAASDALQCNANALQR